jgi:BirA family transcriptional regulator, biotin operon repressor / biotin---[acetyl-CoA-carboxylase] ligase
VSGAGSGPSTHISAALGHPRLHLRRTGSTNELARELALSGAPGGALVTASEQSAGRGRHSRRWSAPANSSVLMSLLLREPPPLLPLIAAVAVCDVAGDRAWIKWPNDIVLTQADERAGANAPAAMAKLAGVLVEGRPQQGWAVLGIGVNVAVRLEELPPELRTGSPARAGAPTGLPAATLGLEPADVEPTLTLLVAALERRLAQPAAAILDAWRALDALLGREIAWEHGRGRAQGVDGAGRLIVALANGQRTSLLAGEVHLRGTDEGIPGGE